LTSLDFSDLADGDAPRFEYHSFVKFDEFGVRMRETREREKRERERERERERGGEGEWEGEGERGTEREREREELSTRRQTPLAKLRRCENAARGLQLEARRGRQQP